MFLKQLAAGTVGELERDCAPFIVTFDDERTGGRDGNIPADGVDRVEVAMSPAYELADLIPEGDGDGFEGKAGIRVVGVETTLDLQADPPVAEGAGIKINGDAQATLVEVGGGGASGANEQGGENDIDLTVMADGNDAEGGDGEGVEGREQLVLADERLDNAVDQSSRKLGIGQAMTICKEGIAVFFKNEGTFALFTIYMFGKESSMAGRTERGESDFIGEEGGFDKERAGGGTAG